MSSYIQRAERRAVAASLKSDGPESLYRDFLRVPEAQWVQHHGDVDLFGDGAVTILAVPGHTPGTRAVLVRLPDRAVLLTGVTASTREAFLNERRPPTTGTPTRLSALDSA